MKATRPNNRGVDFTPLFIFRETEAVARRFSVKKVLLEI